MREYLSSLERAADRVVETLSEKGISSTLLKFGGEGPALGRVTPPTNARSEFLANRAMGDWAEKLLAESINTSFLDLKAVHYGDSDSLSAGDPGFSEFYKARAEDVRVHGKRPDLLILPAHHNCPQDISRIPTVSLDAVVKASSFAVEVRSSKYEALHYAEARASMKAAGKSGQPSQSFTVKVEDLKIVYRWIERFEKPQMYCQVFFDSMFAIDFLEIFEIIGNNKGFKIERPENSQLKTTIFIPITAGIKIAEYKSIPTFATEHTRSQLGRHDAYVRPVGGNVDFDPGAFMRVLRSG